MSITYLEAIREAQAKLLRDDERVFIYGQDVGGTFGGAFKATKGLAKEFPGRVLNTPISKTRWLGLQSGPRCMGCGRLSKCNLPTFPAPRSIKS